MSRVKSTEFLLWQRLVRCVSGRAGPAAGGAGQRCQPRGARPAARGADTCRLRDTDGNKPGSVTAGHASGFYRPCVRRKFGLKHLLLHYCRTLPYADQVNFLMKEILVSCSIFFLQCLLVSYSNKWGPDFALKYIFYKIFLDLERHLIPCLI